MFSLRQTWNEVFPQTKLYALDVKVNVMDPNWPITAKVVRSVHVNPNFLKSNPEVAKVAQQQQPPPKDMLYQQMQAKERELIELKQRKIELELMVTKKKIAEQEKEIGQVLSANVSKSIPPLMKVRVYCCQINCKD
jgi:pre-mRNA cleavage complex 2 protein Pcf11